MRRVCVVSQHLAATAPSSAPALLIGCPTSSGAETVTVTDNRTGKSYELKITDNTIKAGDLKQIVGPTGKPLKTFDPGYTNTTCCVSRISDIDGDKGILRYRGIPIEQLAEKSTFMETAFLVIYGHLPTQTQLQGFSHEVLEHSYVSSDMTKLHEAFRYDAHPMGMLCSAFAAMGTLHPEANPAVAGGTLYQDVSVRNKQIYRILGGGPTLAAIGYRHRAGLPFVQPNPQLSYMENFLYMLDVMQEGPDGYRPHPTLVKAMDILFILHCEHELNCSTSAMRHASSSSVDVYTAISSSVGALYGPRHGGANEAVLRMLEVIGDVSNVEAFVKKVKNREATLMGFGHRVYKNYDPRAKIVRKICDQVFALCGKDPLIDIAMELERTALADDYFVSRKLYPNVDFYSGLIYKSIGIPTDMFTILFALPRLVGWLAHWSEWIDDPDNKIYRPFQIYKGIELRDYEDMSNRQELVRREALATVPRSAINRRRDVAKGDVRQEYSGIRMGVLD